jgi:hypothetical protein
MGRVLDSQENTRVIIGSYEGGWMDIRTIVTSMKKLAGLREFGEITIKSMRSIEYEKLGQISVKQ